MKIAPQSTLCSRRSLRSLAYLLSLFAFACADVHPPIAPALPTSAAAFVTPEVAASLTTAGQFPTPTPLSLQYPQITAVRARELADAYRRIHMPQIALYLTEERGAPVVPSRLALCGRSYYAEPSLEPVAPDVNMALRRAFGPHWIVLFCGPGGDPQVSVAVAAFASDIEMVDGLLRYTAQQGEYFLSQAIRAGEAHGLPLAPERAVAAAGTATGRRTARAPRLIAVPRHYPQRGLWLVELDGPGLFQLEGIGNVSATTVFFGDHKGLGRNEFWLAAAEQPASYPFSWAEPGPFYGAPPVTKTTTLVRRPGVPIRFVRAQAVSR